MSPRNGEPHAKRVFTKAYRCFRAWDPSRQGRNPMSRGGRPRKNGALCALHDRNEQWRLVADLFEDQSQRRTSSNACMAGYAQWREREGHDPMPSAAGIGPCHRSNKPGSGSTWMDRPRSNAAHMSDCKNDVALRCPRSGRTNPVLHILLAQRSTAFTNQRNTGSSTILLP